jgi:hypothetical protein
VTTGLTEAERQRLIDQVMAYTTPGGSSIAYRSLAEMAVAALEPLLADGLRARRPLPDHADDERRAMSPERQADLADLARQYMTPGVGIAYDAMHKLMTGVPDLLAALEAAEAENERLRRLNPQSMT